jgi:DNA-binding NtrC family response regulator
MSRILIVDDDGETCRFMAELLGRSDREIRTTQHVSEALALAREPFDLLISDINLDAQQTGMDVLRAFKQANPRGHVVLISGFGTLQTAIDAVRAGAFDYISKPFNISEVKATVDRALAESGSPSTVRPSLDVPAAGLIGRTSGMLSVYKQIAHAANAAAPVLIIGESGTGKELVARAIHEASPRNRGPFIAVNCAALPRDLAESELFGHVRGAFTGALRDKPGYFELAGGGTLFLDEICELSPELQAKLLRAIDQQEIFRVGGTRQIRTDVRILAATNRNVKSEVDQKRFREDLYFRISVVEIALPPLRERRDDIPLIVEFLLHRLSAELKRHVSGLSNAALRALMSAPWRGNVRELENVLERAILLCDNGSIDVGNLPAELIGTLPASDPADDLRMAVRAYEREHIRQVLSNSGGNREEASRRLGIDASTLYRRMKELNL